MDFNIILIIFAGILLLCIIRGARKGMMRIIFGLVAWILLICFVNYGSDYVADYIKVQTEIPLIVQDSIDSHLHKKYDASEENEEGTGRDAVLSFVPESIREELEQDVQTSIDNTIKLVAQELTSAAINGISTILVIIVGILLIFILDKILKAIGLVPGISDVNRFLGILAGAIEGLLIIWLVMYIAKCFPTSHFGEYVISYIEADQILLFIYNNNVIEQIIGK